MVADAAAGGSPPLPSPRRLGSGFSADVLLAHDTSGRPYVRKVFVDRGPARWVRLLITGSGNPYVRCQAAVETAVARRRVLTELVGWWFGDRLRLPRIHRWSRNRALGTFELHCELIEGRPARRGRDAGSRRELVRRIMPPLQRRLAEAGFDGLVWQAGRGNPMARSNFLWESTGRWVWVDLESGVPALFALNPLATLGFYLPRSWHHRRPLFDDVDLGRLDRYLAAQRSRIESSVHGAVSWHRAAEAAAALGSAQRSWKGGRPVRGPLDGLRARRRRPDAG